ncbi:carbohydrate-binding module family 5 protein [Athelia psychrophila]|uniref:Carbohydrate-binding module family 5 protein n=1 Tax=Athelia psychrophila TaxID=1759441 RepID=A0A165WRA7_9AGAM|nr:carbohydrate-binding module family 5 protein [Fibularhizoctonia sp. CBS 109695]
MVAFTFMRRLALFVAGIAVSHSVVAAPSEVDARSVTPQKRNFLAAAPHFVIYNDKWVTFPTPDELVGYNVFALSFWLSGGSADQAQDWEEEYTAAQRSALKASYNAAGISMIVSAFGSTETPASSGIDPTLSAQNLAAWVKEYDMDGVDVDFEDLAAFNGGTGSAENWLITFTTELRSLLPAGQYIISHAPLAPWFQPSPRWGGGGFLKVDSSVGSLIDFYNVQFYNQGTSEYTDCAGLLTTSSSAWPNTALFQIAASGVSQNKLVIGKPATAADASNGYVDPATLATCVSTAVSKGWNGGIMVWQWPDAESAWIEQVRGTAFPSGGGGGTTTTPPTGPTSTTTSTSATSTPSGGSGSCSGVAAWSSSVAYTGGSQVTYNGDLWTAAYWTEADTPGGSAGVWTKVGAC